MMLKNVVLIFCFIKTNLETFYSKKKKFKISLGYSPERWRQWIGRQLTNQPRWF